MTRFSALRHGLLFLLFAGCTAAPLSKGHDQYYGIVDDTHSFVKNAQTAADHGQFTTARESEDRLAAKLARSECYRITSLSTQWGLYEPEMIFEGESSGRTAGHAFIFVPPVLDYQGTYPSPKDETGITVFRVDQDTPIGDKVIQQLQSLVGRKDFCVRLARVTRTDRLQQDYSVIATQVLEVSAAAAITIPAHTPPAIPASVVPPVPASAAVTVAAPMPTVKSVQPSPTPLPGAQATHH